METAVSALPTIGTGEGDVLPVVCPGHLVSFVLHELDEALSVVNVFQCLVDRMYQIQLPAVSPKTSLVLTGPHLLFAGAFLWRLQHIQIVSNTDFIIRFPVLLEVGGVLVELSAVNTTDAVDHQMVV